MMGQVVGEVRFVPDSEGDSALRPAAPDPDFVIVTSSSIAWPVPDFAVAQLKPPRCFCGGGV